MLAEWYFCCCISANPSDTEAFLSILDSLENPDSDSQLLYLAYKELKRTEYRMQIYAVPAVLKSLHRDDLPDELKNTIKRYLKDLVNHLVENVPDKVENSVRQLINLVFDSQPSEKIIQVVNTFVAESQHLPERRLTPTPYLDLKEFLPETLVLAILADQLENNEKLIDELITEVNDQEQTDSTISLFLESALDYQLGRLAFRLSVLIASLTSTEYPDTLRSLIAQKASVAAQAEPDLLDAYAIALFRDKSTKNTPHNQCQRIIEESQRLSELRNLIREIPDQNPQDLDVPFRYVSIKNTPNRTECLPILYWQIVLWELAAQIDVSTTADELVKLWHPPTRLPRYLNVNCSETDIPAQVEAQFKSLLNLRGLPREIPLKVNHGNRFYINNQYTWLFYSPWIARLKNPKKPYPSADEPTLLFRSIGTAFVAIRLLQQLSQDNFKRVEFAARFIAHASDVNATVKRRNNKDEFSQIYPPLEGLLQFLYRQIRLAGTGQFESIHPRIFVEICDKGQLLQEEGAELSDEESVFLNSVLPEVLISWILDAYPSAVSPKLSGRWLSLIPDVYNHHIRESRHSFPERQKAALVTRFLCPNYSHRLDERLNWKIERSHVNKKLRWQVNYRKLLLTKRLHPNEWNGWEWNNENVDWGNDPKTIASNRLVYTLESLDALGRYISEYEIEPKFLEQTFSDWKHYLNGVGQAKELDRFTRLRLLEFLDSSILENRSEEQIMLASVLIEYGSIYEIKSLLERVYPTEADGRIFKETEPARQDLQVALLPMISNFLEKHRVLTEDNYDQTDNLSQQVKAKSPRETYKQLQYVELFQEWITRLLYLSSIHENNEGFSELGVNLANLRRTSLNKKATTTIRTKSFNVEFRNNQKLINTNKEYMDDWLIKAINYNCDRLNVTMFYEDYDLNGVENLFRKIPHEVRGLEHQTDPPLNVVAVVVGVDTIEENDHSQWKYTFDCGFEFPLTYSSNQPLTFKPGDRVKLPIRQFKEGNEIRWKVRVSDDHSIKRLTHKTLPGDLDKIEVDEIWKDGRRTWSLQRISNTEKITDKVNLRLWDANISRCFCQHSSSLKREVFAKLVQQEWVPFDLDFSDLLFQVFHSQPCSHIAVLTLIGEEIGQFGEKVWRFSRQPGENYLIEQHCFLGDDATTLSDVIASYQDRTGGAVGLLISVTPDFEAGQVGLRLVTDAINPVFLNELYPNLSVPFDERNIQWRELFDRSDERLIAEKNNHGNWFFHLQENMEIPGYPRQVEVKWDNRIPHRNLTTADLDIIQWQEPEWRDATVKGETPPFYKITPQNNDWVAFLDRWLNLPEKQYIEAGCRVSLKGEQSLGSIYREGDGFVPCLTSENVFVLVQAESLTMLPLKHQTKLPIGKNREAEIFWIEWFEIQGRPDIRNITIPDEAIQNHRCVGIITLVPKPGTEGSQCQVVWQMSQGNIQEQGLQIDNLTEIRLNQGYKIVGQKHHGQWTFHIEKPNIRCRAIWLLKPWKSLEIDELYYLETVTSSEGEDLDIAESTSFPGQLICLPDRPQETSHLARGKKIDKKLRFSENSLWEDNRTSNTARYKKYAFDERPFQYRRAILKLDDQLLIGNCREWIGNEKVTVQGVELVLTPRNEQKYVLRRRFNLRPIYDIKRPNKNIDANSLTYKRKLEDYLQKLPKPLRATFAQHRGELGFWLSTGEEIRVPEDSSGENWTLWVPLAPEQGKFVMAGNYSDQARICLFMEQGRVWASCRLVPPRTLKEFRVDSCEAPASNTDVFLLKDKNVRLYYVGPEDVNKLTGEPHPEIHHRFEMGYGETLLIPESQLEFDDGSFSKAQLTLFYGDLIKVISFKETRLEDSGNDKGYPYILNIKSLYLQWSEAHQLYYQRSRYQIVHLLHLNPQSQDLEISYIDGFNENALAQQRKFEPKRFKAYLTPESQVRLSQRQQRWRDNEESDPVIFGRLDEERFKSSHGRDIYFDHVRLSFVESEKGSCLLNRDLVFLRANKIIKSGENDMALTLKPPKGFDQEDIGKDAKRLRVLRRSFSARENLLKQIHQEKGEYYFQDDRLLIQLAQKQERKITSHLLMKGDQAPTRKASALIGAVSNLGKAGLLATIVSADDRSGVQIEYKPGIFIHLKPNQIQSRPDDLLKGTIVRIEASDRKVNITRAAFGNAQYVSENIRPVVILPTNDIQRLAPENWASQGRFTIGGLPDIVSHPGTYINEQWHNTPPSQAITDLMARRHPKIACLGEAATGDYRIAPPSDNFPCGHLTRIDNSLTVQYVPLNSTPTDSNNPILPWHLLSFGDESVQHIINRANSASWRYHDNETFTWVSDTQKLEVEKLCDYTVWTGPIFFQSVNGELRLRYSKSEFRRFGFPVEELIYTLKQGGRSHFYPIAGISESVASRSQSSEYTVWIELAPGRLVELPTQLIIWGSGVNNKYQSLTNLMHWQGFAPGDQVELELVSTDPLTIDRIALKNWIPGARHALGSNRCFLPVEAVDEKQGEITLGRGEFKLTLPFADQNPNWLMAILTPKNYIHGITPTSPKRHPKPNDVVFLEINAQDQLAVVGFETMKPLLDKKKADDWKRHPITGCLITTGKLFLKKELLKDWIRAAGGVLPVTVEGLHKPEDQQAQHLLFFSMRHQQDAALIPPGCISLARFVDLLPDQYTAMLRCGGGLITLPMREIVSGLDRSLYTEAAAQLKQNQVSFWLRQEQNGIKVGFSDDFSNQNLLVKSLDILLQKDGEGEAGLICQSVETTTLHWFPIQEAAWTTLSVAEFRDVFKFESKGAFKVRRKPITLKKGVKTSIISVLDVPDVKDESEKLVVGQELFVQVVKQVETNDENKQRYLVESLKTQVILDCEIYEDCQALQPGETLPVEVASHIKGSPELITVVPVGKKPKYLDLPTWMTKQLPEPGRLRQSIRQYFRWRKSEQYIRDPSNSLDRLLCHYFNDTYGTTDGKAARNSDPKRQLEVAKKWEQQNRYKPEINAAFAIMAILLLNKHEETKLEAYQLTQNLGLSALRSLHIEVLYQRWLNTQDNRQRTDGLWQRLQELEGEQHLYVPLKENSPAAIRQFCNAVEMRSDNELLPIANSLSAALGELSSTVEIEDHAWITKQLIDLYLTLHPKSRIKELQKYHTNKLEEILKRIDQNRLDIMLLEPLHYHVHPNHYSKDLREIYLWEELFPQEHIKADWKSWILQQIDHLDALTDNSISLGENINELKCRFRRINQIIEE
jgi:hypothetical protein